MTRSVPRGGGRFYPSNLAQSPLLQLQNYPASIVRRITNTLGTAGEGQRRNRIPK